MENLYKETIIKHIFLTLFKFLGARRKAQGASFAITVAALEIYFLTSRILRSHLFGGSSRVRYAVRRDHDDVAPQGNQLGWG